MGMDKVPIGAMIGSGVLLLLGISFLTVADGGVWTLVSVGFIVLGFIGLIASGAKASDPVQTEAADATGLEQRLAELDDLKERGVLNATEHRRKRRELVDAWGLPEA